jgi:hypothetical protein
MKESARGDSVRRFLLYLAYTIFFILLLKYGCEYGYYRLQYPGSKYLDYYLLGKPIVFFGILLYHLSIGLMLAFPRFISNLRKTGTWKFDWVVFLAVCIPTLYVLVTPWIPVTLWPFWPLFNYICSAGTLVHSLATIIFAFFLISSFRKTDM